MSNCMCQSETPCLLTINAFLTFSRDNWTMRQAKYQASLAQLREMWFHRLALSS